MVTVTPERRAAAEGIHAEMMPSANPVDDLAMHNRRDPYWDRLWVPGSQANWITGPMARHHKKEGISPVNAKLLLDEDEAPRIATANRGRTDRLAAWGVLDSWRTVSSEQLAALTGCQYFLDPNYSSMAASFSLDLVDVGTYANKLRPNPGMNSSVVFRTANSEAFSKVIEPTLTGPEWLSVTAGQPWSTGGHYDRHNVLSTELGLRAAEYLDIGTALGEKLSSIDLLAGSGLGKKLNRPDGRRADGTIVRHDGMRVVFELTATASTSFENKVRRWAQVISERPLETSGLTVVFIAAPHPDRSSHTGNHPRHEIYRILSKVLREFPGRGQDSPAARIGIAHWEEWFPDRHLMSEAFFNLEADFAINDATGPDRWARRGMLMDYAFTPWHTFDATAVLENSKLLAATPHWLRKGDHTAMIGSPMDRAQVEVPHPAPAKPHLTKGRPLGAAIGNGGDAKLPKRPASNGKESLKICAGSRATISPTATLTLIRQDRPGEIMHSLRSKPRGAIVRIRHELVKVLPATGWTLALPLMVMGLAGCGGASDASAPTPSTTTASAPAEPMIQQARHSCDLDSSVFSPYATLGDAGHTITMQGEPETFDVANYGKVTGLTAKHMACILTAVSVPDSVVSQMDATRALDGMQKASWDKFSASWTYHPDNGLKVILTESK